MSQRASGYELSRRRTTREAPLLANGEERESPNSLLAAAEAQE
jgi:hypothetical protein